MTTTLFSLGLSTSAHRKHPRPARWSKPFFRWLCLCLCLVAAQAEAQNYQFSGTMSREVLDNYLDRSITMQGQSDVEGDHMLTNAERQRNVAMLNDIGAKFVGRIGGWWESGSGRVKHQELFDKVQLNIQEIHANDPEVICQGAIFEYVSGTVTDLAIPAHVFQEFGLPVVTRNFNYSAMLYPGSPSQYIIYGREMSPGEHNWMPDMTQQETQLWFYYMATRYIDAGCEAIHFGQTEVMSRRDVGNRQWWGLLQRVRRYARAHARRGLVVCDAHVTGIGSYYEPNLSLLVDEWQSYEPVQDFQKLLLWDFHSMWVGYQEASGCTGAWQPVTLNPQANRGLHRRSLGGQHPQGWLCRRNPYLVELDNGGVELLVGCGYNPSQSWSTYGWDEISWFALQQEWYRNQVLLYTYNKVKCMDLNGHFEMPGMRVVTPGNGQDIFMYRANTGNANTGNRNQQVTIKSIWNGSQVPVSNWVKHNFSDEQVANSPNPGLAGGNLIFVGNNRMYYIGTDGYVHGYVRYGGTWLTTSPSYSAANGGSVSGQMTADNSPGSLVANPSGTVLYYRGTDGFIYQFQIIDDWTYTYSGMPTNGSMAQQGLRVAGALICPTDSRIYYTAREIGNSNAQRVHAFINSGGTWATINVSTASGNPANQVQVAGDLVANPSGTVLYYRGTDGFIYQFQILNDWSYSYSGMPTNGNMAQQGLRASGSLVCPTDERIYYIATELPNSSAQRVHALIKYGTTWATTSPTWASNNAPGASQVQARPGSLSCSPSNGLIAYIGSDAQMHGFNILNDWQYNYFDFKPALAHQTGAGTTRFNAQNNLFYISGGQWFSDRKVHQYTYEADWCGSAPVQAVEQGCCGYGRSAVAGTTGGTSPSDKAAAAPLASARSEASDLLTVEAYPNPAKDVVNVTAAGGITRIVLVGPEGKTHFQQAFSEAPVNAQVPVSALPAGLYFLKVSTKGRTVNQKIVIAR